MEGFSAADWSVFNIDSSPEAPPPTKPATATTAPLATATNAPRPEPAATALPTPLGKRARPGEKEASVSVSSSATLASSSAAGGGKSEESSIGGATSATAVAAAKEEEDSSAAKGKKAKAKAKPALKSEMPLYVQSAAVRKHNGFGILVQLDQAGFDVAGDTGVIGRFGLICANRVAAPARGSSHGDSDDSDASYSDSDENEDANFHGPRQLLLDMKGTEFEGRLSRAGGTMLLVEVAGAKKGGKQEARVVVEQLIDNMVDITSTRSCLGTLAGVRVKGGDDTDDGGPGGSDSDFEPTGGRRRSSTSTLSSKGRGRGRGRGRGGGGAASKATKKKGTGKGKGNGTRGRGRSGGGGAKPTPKKKAGVAATVSLADLVHKRAKAVDAEKGGEDGKGGQAPQETEISDFGTEGGGEQEEIESEPEEEEQEEEGIDEDSE